MEGSFMKSNSFQVLDLWLAHVLNVEDMSIHTRRIVPWNVESMVARNVPQKENEEENKFLQLSFQNTLKCRS
jgi:hypothetical protein